MSTFKLRKRACMRYISVFVWLYTKYWHTVNVAINIHSVKSVTSQEKTCTNDNPLNVWTVMGFNAINYITYKFLQRKNEHCRHGDELSR